MCTVSDKLKLCTCKTKNAASLKHYWILKRNNGQNLNVYGQAILPANIGDHAHKLNEKTLRKSLNQGTCFDIALHHQEKDILILHFSCKAEEHGYINFTFNGDYLAYAFVFEKGRWRKTDFDPFGANLDEIESGKIVNPLEKIKDK